MSNDSPIRVVSANEFDADDRRRLEAISDRIEIAYLGGMDHEALCVGLKDPDVEVLLGSFLPDDLDQVPNLRWVQVGSVGVAHLDLDEVRRRGIVVTNAKGLYATPIGEFVIGAMISIGRNLPLYVRNQIDHRWEDPPIPGNCLRGQRIAIVGYGGIGREVARLARSFGMEVLAAKRNPGDRGYHGYRLPGTGDADGSLVSDIVSIRDLPDRLGNVDYLVVALPDAASSRAIVGRDIIDALPPNAWLINVGRGSTIDDEALSSAITDGRLGGAFLDVTAPEHYQRRVHSGPCPMSSSRPTSPGEECPPSGSWTCTPRTWGSTPVDGHSSMSSIP